MRAIARTKSLNANDWWRPVLTSAAHLGELFASRSHLDPTFNQQVAYECPNGRWDNTREAGRARVLASFRVATTLRRTFV